MAGKPSESAITGFDFVGVWPPVIGNRKVQGFVPGAAAELRCKDLQDIVTVPDQRNFATLWLLAIFSSASRPIKSWSNFRM